MSTFTHRIEVGDPQGTQFEAVDVLVDTGATFTVIPESLLRRLGVVPRRAIPLRLADGSIIQRDIGEAQVQVDGQTVPTLVVFGADEAPALLGVYTLEAALLAVDPVGQRLVPTEALLMTTRSSSTWSWL